MTHIIIQLGAAGGATPKNIVVLRDETVKQRGGPHFMASFYRVCGNQKCLFVERNGVREQRGCLYGVVGFMT